MQFKNELTKIKTINQLNETIKILDLYYNREVTERLLTETENELKQLNEQYNLKLEHEIFYNKRNELYNKLNMKYFKLNNNEMDITTNQTELIEQLETNEILYIFDLYQLKDIETELFKNFEINITSEYHIIINTETEKIFNLTSENIEEFIKYLMVSNGLKDNDNLLLEIYNNINDNELKFNNQYELSVLFKTNRFKLISYNENDKYLFIDYIHEKIKSVNYIDLSISEILEMVLNDNTEIINIIIDNI